MSGHSRRTGLFAATAAARVSVLAIPIVVVPIVVGLYIVHYFHFRATVAQALANGPGYGLSSSIYPTDPLNVFPASTPSS